MATVVIRHRMTNDSGAVRERRLRQWEALVAPLLTEQLRRKRRGKASRKWHTDETYIKIQGGWCYLYRALDADGNLVDAMLSLHRDLEAAKRFFARSREVVGHTPKQVTTDGHDAYPRAIREALGPEVIHRCSRYKNNVIEQDHRGIKGRYRPLRGCGSVIGAARFCAAYEEGRDHFRHRTRLNAVVPLRVQRAQFCARLTALRALVPAA
jgi:putative transposase